MQGSTSKVWWQLIIALFQSYYLRGLCSVIFDHLSHGRSTLSCVCLKKDTGSRISDEDEVAHIISYLIDLAGATMRQFVYGQC